MLLGSRGAETRFIADEWTRSRSCAEQIAQAEAGLLMRMVRRANMELSIAASRGNRKARRTTRGIKESSPFGSVWSKWADIGLVAGGFQVPAGMPRLQNSLKTLIY